LYTRELGIETDVVEINTHICSGADYDKFYDPLEEQKAMIEQEVSASNFYCLNELDKNGDKW